MNLIIYDDNSGISTEFLIDITLLSGHTYILVVTTAQASVKGVFLVSARGPASASLTKMMPSTGKPIESG